MACLVKLPHGDSKGTVTFTTVEWRRISADASLLERLERLRHQYVTGLHFNWHDYQFTPPPQFDFFMAGEGDLRPVDATPFRLVPMDACNFTPAAYRPLAAAEKFWDILAVGNPVYFKRPEVVLRTIRKLFDSTSRPLRVLYICPLPPRRLADEDTVFYDVRDYYESLFTAEERQRFVLLTTSFDSPNPFDRNSLSVFFRNSRVFLHCPTEERRCRIAAYAWCAGLPVVAYPSVASLLPSHLRAEPGYFQVTEDEQYVPQLLRALGAASNFEPAPHRRELSEIETIGRFGAELASVYAELDLPFKGPLFTANLDRRLGWHHEGMGGVANGVSQPLAEFMDCLSTHQTGIVAGQSDELEVAQYPERLLEPVPAGTKRSADAVERASIYLNPRRKRWLRLAKLLRARLGLG